LTLASGEFAPAAERRPFLQKVQFFAIYEVEMHRFPAGQSHIGCGQLRETVARPQDARPRRTDLMSPSDAYE
jgi:hypothetical protein